MHARIEHLLSLRDGEPVASEVAAHVRACPVCTGELQRLSAIRVEMQSLPQLDPPEMSWARIQQTIPQRRAVVAPRRIGFAAAAAAVVTLTAIALIARHGDRQSSQPSANSTPPKVVNEQAAQDDVLHLDQLVAQSQHLEQILQTLPQRPRIERVSTAATIDTIEQRIAWLDFQLSSAPDDDLSEEQSRRLWSERVELMDSLVKVRYAEAGSLWF
ncbi:MAG: hypothetical protein ABW171_10400 [Steroidobacter sp.]